MPPRPFVLIWDDRFRAYDFGPDHPFTERSRWLAVRLLDALHEAGIPIGDRVDTVDPADRALLGRFHTPEYLGRVERFDREGEGRPLDQGDTPSFAGCFEASARIVSGTVKGLELLEGESASVAFNPSGGLHHAHPGRASGFCIFNDVAVAIAKAVAPGSRYDRVAYLDVDAHHGDGVMYGFYESGRVLDIDFHQDGRTIFPGTGFPREAGRGDGAGLKVNVPLPPGTGDVGLLRLFRRLVPPLLAEYRPKLIVLQNGVDGHTGDRLGATSLEYTPEGYRGAVEVLRGLLPSIGNPPILVTGGGGYSPENVARVLAGVALWFQGGSSLPPARLPPSWRDLFEAETGVRAPLDWEVEAAPAPWEERVEEGLVNELERALGRKFPAPGASRP